ncbi:MAG: transcriptional regulator MraZ [Desulfovibrio sp.]|nr:MAG: transcriptional regulator MraZ [Desulfovibrio sp.]
MLFRGRFFRSLDPKGRIMLPPEFRDTVLACVAEGKVVLTTFDGCVVGYPLPDWEEFEEKFNRLRNPSRKMRDFRRLVIGGAEEAAIDKQGRLALSKALREYGGLSKDLVLVGQGRKFEIWDQGKLDAVMDQDFDDVTEELADSGIDFNI